jgi:O-acetyl-ADP-ribose deacetylase (regulator of RNase III)
MSAPSTLSVNNILSFNGHGGKDSGKTFILPKNVYVLVPFGLGVDGVKKPDGTSTQTTDENFKGLDVCYGFPSPQNKDGKPQSFEDIIYGKDGKLKLTFDSNVDAKWYLYKPDDVVPNVNYYPWKTGDTAGVSCGYVSTKYDPFVSDLMKKCLSSGSTKLNKNVCALFVSDSTKTQYETDGVTTKSSEVLKDNDGKGNYHLKLKICGDDPNVATTTLEELASNCRKLVEFSRDYVKNKKSSGETYETGYEDDKIFPKSGTDDPIILLPFSCNSCDLSKDIELKNDTSDLTKVATLSEIIAGLAPITLDEQTTIFKYDKSDVLNISDYISVINTIYESTKTKEVKKPGDIITSDYHDVLPSGSASIVKLDEFSSTKNKDLYFINRDDNIKFILQAAPGSNEQNDLPSYGANGLTNSVYNCLYLANKNNVKGIAFPIIGGQIFFDKLKIPKNKLYELLLQGVANYFNDFDDSEIEIVLFAQPNIEDNSGSDNFEEVFTTFLTTYTHINKILKKLKNTNKKDPKNPKDTTDDFDASVFAVSKIYNDESANHTKITALVNAANTELKFGTGLSGEFAKKINFVYHNLSTTIDKHSKELIKKFHEAYVEYVKSLTGSSPPPTPPPTPPVVKKLFADIIKDLEGKLTNASENDTEIKSLGITLPTDFLYPLNGSDADKKNLNSAEPTIDTMITAFETAADGDDTKFYLGACRSIQAAYKLEFDAITGSDTNANEAKMRAKLLLNLRKNSLLLKVPAWWDYAKMELGEAPALTPDQVKAKYEELQQECAALKGGYQSEEAYKLAEQLIPLDTEIENEKLEKKNKVVLENYPDNKITYPPIKDVIPGYNLVLEQHDMNCGRAALANFFGTEDFLIKGDPTKTEVLFNLKIQRPVKIDMSSICHLNKKYSDIFLQVPNNKKDKEDYDYVTKCPTDENYSINVLSIVLQVLGYKDLIGITFDKNNMSVYGDNMSKLKESYSNENVLGYLVNINKGHWICYKRQGLDSNTNSFYRINSVDDNFKDARTLEKLVENDSITNNNNFIQLHPITKNNDSYNQKIFSKLTAIDEGNKNYYKDKITENETNNKWKLFKKDVTSLLVKESTYSPNINDQVRIMNYLSNLPSNKSDTNNDIKIGLNDQDTTYGSIQSKILSLTPEKKQQVIDIFIKNIKNNLNTLNFITANNCNLRNIGYDKENNLYEPDFDAKNRYYYSLTQTCNYKTDANFSTDLTSNGYYKSANTLLNEIDTLFKTSEFTSSSPGGGGFKPNHNAITNHSKSRHNSSFKVSSSSKSKGKSHNRSHTQRVK